MADEGNTQRQRDFRTRQRGFRTAVEDAKALAMVLAMEAESVLGKRIARFLGIVALFLVVIALLLVFLDWYVAPTKPSDKKDLVVALAQILAGTALLSGLYFTWRTLQINREGQITDRFTRAIDQLGATDDDGNRRLEIRLGGIYALERIDKESPERAYHSTVMEVLTAYVRENAPWPPKPSKPPKRLDADSVSGSAFDEAAEQDTGAEPAAVPAGKTPSTDIQAILEVLKRREEEHVPEKYRVPYLDLRGTDLRGADLREAPLKGALLIGAHLEKADLFGAHLEGAELIGGAHLEEADLMGAHLEEADLIRAHLEEASLWVAHLEGANLRGAHLEGANLRGADLDRARLADAHLEGARLADAHLKGARNLPRSRSNGLSGTKRRSYRKTWPRQSGGARAMKSEARYASSSKSD